MDFNALNNLNPDFLYIYQESPGAISELFEGLSQRQYHLGQLGIDRNTFVYWKKLGLLPYEKEGKGWGRFSFFECVWLKTILDFRGLGVPMERIVFLRKKLWFESGAAFVSFLQEASVKNAGLVASDVLLAMKELDPADPEAAAQFEAMQISQFSLMVVYCILKKEGYGLLLDKNSNLRLLPLGPALTEQAGVFQAQLFTESFVMVNLYPLIQELCLLEQVKLSPQLTAYIATSEEQRLLKAIRSGRYEEIIVRVGPEGKPTHIQLKETKVTSQLLAYLRPYLKQGIYKDIQFKVRDGRLIDFASIDLTRL